MEESIPSPFADSRKAPILLSRILPTIENAILSKDGKATVKDQNVFSGGLSLRGFLCIIRGV
jgi:hypothetical protein